MKLIKTIAIYVCCFSVWNVSAQIETCTCCTENHKAFDFWIGNWEVTDSSGEMLGTNRILKLQDDCILQENWTGSSGSTGISTNFFNSQSQQWEQLWADNQGTYLKLKGNRKGNQMILSSDEFTHTDGNTYVNRITWTHNANGTVRQLWEIVKGEQVVNVAFDGLYTKVK